VIDLNIISKMTYLCVEWDLKP